LKFRITKDKSKLILVESTREEFNQLHNWLSPYVKGYRFMPRFKLTNWNGKYEYMSTDGRIDFGLWHECYKCCKEYGYPFKVENKDEFPRDDKITLEHVRDFALNFFKEHKTNKGEDFTPYIHQIEAAYKMLKHRYGTIEVATSGGKSLIFSIMVFFILSKRPDAKILLIVPSISLVTQFYDDMLDYNIGFNKENKTPLDLRIQEIMSDRPRKVRDDVEPNIYIGTYQSLINWGTEELEPDFFKQFNVVMVDEAHTAKATTLTTILKKTFGHAHYRLGMSGTYPSENSSEWMAIESVTGPKLITVKAKELMDKGLISKVKIKCLLLQYDDLEFAESVYTIKKHGGGKRALELEKEYAQNSEKRKSFIGKLVNKFNNNSLMLFHNIAYGTELYNYLRSNVIGKDFYYIDGETPAKKRQYIKEQMEKTDGNPKILVASFGTLSTGVSIKALKNIVFCDSFKSARIVLQSIGRALRLHEDKEGDKAVVFDLVDQFHSSYKTILYNHYISRRDELYKKQQYPHDEIKIVI
jgi:superfamily II DNA or RNA helicase